MKRLVMTLSIMVVLGIITPGLPTIAQPGHVPHENPATATDLSDRTAILLSYSQIINLATSRQYQDARDALNDLQHIDIPDELRYITDRYRNLCQQLITTLDKLDSLLDEAATMLAQNRIHEAKQRLDDAEVNIQYAGSLLVDIEAATDTLVNQLGAIAGLAADQIERAYIRLEESIERLREMIAEFDNLSRSYNDRYIQKMELMPTEVSLTINPVSVFMGDNVTASGRLTSDGRPLAGREVTLIARNKSVTTVITGIDGSYSTSIEVPREYTSEKTFTATYEPSGDDKGKYLACHSQPVTIRTMFYRTLLELPASRVAYPGLAFTINGRIVSTIGNIDRTVMIFRDKTKLAEETTSGEFSLEVTPPEDISIDSHTLTVSVTAQGRSAGVARTMTMRVSQMPIHIDAEMPDLVLLPGKVWINGRVYDKSSPIPDILVTLGFGNSSGTTRTSPDGSFTALLEAPLDLSFIGPRELTMAVEPDEPHYAPLQKNRQLFTINSVNTGLILAALSALGFFFFRRSRARVTEDRAISASEVMALPAIVPKPAPAPGLTGIRGRILSAYQGGLEAVERVIGVHMTPDTTLREFLKTATRLSPQVNGRFAELTTMAEMALYARYNPRKDSATRAEHLAAAIKEELHRGTS